MINQIEKHNGYYEETEIEGPVLFCEATNWKPFRMKTMIDFCHDSDA